MAIYKCVGYKNIKGRSVKCTASVSSDWKVCPECGEKVIKSINNQKN
jgi:hypothetical protein